MFVLKRDWIKEIEILLSRIWTRQELEMFEFWTKWFMNDPERILTNISKVINPTKDVRTVLFKMLL